MRNGLLAAVTLAALVPAAAAAQPTTYSYVGGPYTTATAPYAVGGRLTGSFTVASPLPAFLPLTDLTPALAAMSFDDTAETRTLANSFLCSFKVATDGAGNVSQWQISLRRSPYNPGDPHHSIDSTGVPGVFGGTDLVGTGIAPAGPCDPMVLAPSANSTAQGTWTDTDAPPEEPTTYTYTGAPYTTAGAPYALGNRLTGSFTTANPLPPFLPFTDVTPALESMSFDDTVETRSLANSFLCSFKVATDGAGNITRWQISLRRLPYNPGDPHHAIDSTGTPAVHSGIDVVGTGVAPVSPCDPMALAPSASSSAEGTWTDTHVEPEQPTTYTYTGAPYTSAAAPYALGNRLTGSITTANPLPPFLPLTDITPALASMSFDDSVETRSLADSFVCSFEVATDGAGNITRWQVSLRRRPYNPGDPHHAIDSNGSPGTAGGFDVVGTGTAPAGPCDPMVLASTASSSARGTWTDSNPLAAQPTTYHYLGDPYVSATPPYSVGNRLNGTITLANPLPPFLPLTDITPALAAMSFDDSVETRTLASSFLCSFRVATDGAGHITQWQVSLRRSPYNPGNPHHAIDSSGSPGPFGGIDLVGTGIAPAGPCDPMVLDPSASTQSPGTWTGGAGGVVTVPALEGLGMAALAALLALSGLGVLRRRRA